MTPADISLVHVVLRMVLAVVLGGFIGLEREKRSQAAGLRTHMLVSLGSALVMLISVYGFPVLDGQGKAQVDVARIAAQVVSGVGFLGAGTIIRNGTSVKGLTTAASLWVSAAIGLACGSGFITAALLGCGLSLVALWVLNQYDIKNRVAHRLHLLEIIADEREGWLTAMTKEVEEQGMSVRSFRMHAVSAARSKSWTRWLQPEREEASDSEEPDEAEGRDEDEQDPADGEAGSGRFVRIELKVLAEDMKSIAACSELLLAKEGVRDVRLVS
ncbi:MgtC/SapB family protein [Paenibacillus thiaminolyticus]|uniref:MgtC/SapB family protein n=1 Tax=Paenibacillus thiaminolyticus TaxID=49283 RepID=UPI002350E45F|nr:MgtC/SapB family protein [Paenibacillus thiaminolyticus]MDG0872918.1 MgtC/SapB family protein [Paenibacillus thiaminolyticus]WCR25603.1 MgtC/SapB family protein [Paenibacillus thiaminolyticus]